MCVSVWVRVPSSAPRVVVLPVRSFPLTSRIEDTTISFGVRVEVKVLLWLVLATASFLIRFLLAVVSYTVHIV